MRYIKTLFCLSLMLVLVHPVLAQTSPLPWPTEGWQTSSPEAQGMNAKPLAAMLDFIADNDINVHSVAVIRNGYLVMEAYREFYNADTLNTIYSCTKSFTSALVGIAMEQGYIDNLDQPILSYFPDYTFAHLDAQKQAITLENLLTMSAGLEWTRNVAEIGMADAIRSSPDWIQFVLDRPMADEPGTQFVYNSGASHLLATTVERTTQQPLLTFAQKNLFEPLGIRSLEWEATEQGNYWGGWGLRMTTRDMAKFGYLFLNNGQWDNQQIIPASWVKASTQPLIAAQSLSDDYGYQWWVDAEGYYMALGFGGQYIIIHPETHLVVVFTSAVDIKSYAQPEMLFRNMILPAIQGDTPLPESIENKTILDEAVQAFAAPKPPITIPTLPESADRISQNVYWLDDNILGLKSLALNFTEGAATAQLTLNGEALEMGLDNRPRFNPSDQFGSIQLVGRWRGKDTFVYSSELLGTAELIEFKLTFKDQAVNIRMTAITSGESITVEGRLE